MNMDREMYLREISRIIRENFRADDDVTGSMTVAKIGLLVHQVLRTSPREQGFLKLKDALLELERKGDIRLAPNSKHAFAVQLPVPVEVGGGERESLSDLPAGGSFRRLQKRLWLAFVSDSPHGRRFMHRRTGNVLLGQAQDMAVGDDWLEIEKIPHSEAQADARDFIEAECPQQAKVQLQGDLESDYWYVRFPTALAGIRRDLAAKWNRRRSAYVINKAEDWRLQHGVREDLVYEPMIPDRAPSAPAGPTGLGDLREALFSAVQLMEPAELLELRIPARYLVAVLRPDLIPQE